MLTGMGILWFSLGRGGWVSRLVSLGCYGGWVMSAYVLRLDSLRVYYEIPRSLRLLALLAGWCAILRVALARIGGRVFSPDALSLALIGILAGWVVESRSMASIVWFLDTTAVGGALLDRIPGDAWVLRIFGPPATALGLLTGLGVMALLKKRWAALPWALLSPAAALGGVVVWCANIAMLQHLEAMGKHLGDSGYVRWVALLPWLLFEIAWFAWWATRLTQPHEASHPA